jgi:two-component sensor histidine kinase
MKSLMPSRATLDKLLALGGIVVLAFEVNAFEGSPFHLPVIALGVLMIYIGSWRMAGGLVHKRANKALRAEINHFISLVRQLYASRTEADAAAIHETKDALRESLERIISAASTYQEQD